MRLRTTLAGIVFALLLAVSAHAQTPAPLSTTTCPGAGCQTFIVEGMGSAGVQITGTFVGTLQFEQTIDNATWMTLSLTPNGGSVGVTSATATGLWFGSIAGAKKMRVRFSAFTSGTANVSTSVTSARLGGSGSLFAGDGAADLSTGDTVPSTASVAAFGVPIFAFSGIKTTTTDVTNRQAGHVSHLLFAPATPTTRIQRAYYGVVEASHDNTTGRYRGVQGDVFNVGSDHATQLVGLWTDVYNGVYVPVFTGGGLVDQAYGVYGYIHQQTANASSAITNANAGYFVVDSNSPNSPVTNGTGVTGYVFADAPDPSGLKNIAVAAGGDFETVATIGTITTAYGVYQYVQQNGGTITTGYGNYIEDVQATTKWGYYNNSTSAPSLSKSNWRAPFFAGEASTVLSVTTNAIAPVNVISHVGAGLVKTITVPAMCTPTCAIHLIPDSAFTYDATGNIVVPAGGGTATVNKLMVMAWDGTKWYPSY